MNCQKVTALTSGRSIAAGEWPRRAWKMHQLWLVEHESCRIHAGEDLHTKVGESLRMPGSSIHWVERSTNTTQGSHPVSSKLILSLVAAFSLSVAGSSVARAQSNPSDEAGAQSTDSQTTGSQTTPSKKKKKKTAKKHP